MVENHMHGTLKPFITVGVGAMGCLFTVTCSLPNKIMTIIAGLHYGRFAFRIFKKMGVCSGRHSMAAEIKICIQPGGAPT